MESKPTDTSSGLRSIAEQVLEQVGEAVLQRLRGELPRAESAEEMLRFVSDVDTTSYPQTKELRFENTFEARQLYQHLPGDQQYEVFTALHSSARYALSRAEPIEHLNERDLDVYVFGDQSAAELITYRHRRDEPLFFPAVRAISWQEPVLLIGDQAHPAEVNLCRLGYQETLRANDTTLYRHYDPTMPLLGYGFCDGHHHVTVFNKGQIPSVVSVPAIPTGVGQLIDLRQPKAASILEITEHSVAGEPTVRYRNQGVATDTRYPVAMLGEVGSRYGIELTEENARRLLNGQKTDVITTDTGSMGKLYVLNTPDNGPQLMRQDVRKELTLKESYLGHVFSDQDRQNLHKYGDMGRTVELIDKQSGQRFTGFVGVDKDTKTLTVLRVDVIRPKIERMTHLKGVSLDGLQKQRLIEGKAVRLENMTSKAGTTFSAYVRVSAAARSLRFDLIPNGKSVKDNLTKAPVINAVNSTKSTSSPTQHRPH